MDVSAVESASSVNHSTQQVPAPVPAPVPVPVQQLYVANVSKRFLIISTFISLLIAYSAGRSIRHIVIQVDTKKSHLGKSSSLDEFDILKMLVSISSSIFYLQQDKDTNTETDTNTDTDIHTCNSENDGIVCTDPTSIVIDDADNNVVTQDEDEDDDVEIQLPAGHHLLVDIKNVDKTFLNSETRLIHAMIDVVNVSKLELLSYHCHSHIPPSGGISCVGVSLESHLFFRTWPEEGVVILDLFSSGHSRELVPILPHIERAFAIPEVVVVPTNNDTDKDDNYHGLVKEPVVNWSHKLRGFRYNQNIWANDLGILFAEASYYDLKQEVASTVSEFQRIHIYDVIDTTDGSGTLSYQKSKSNDGSYQSKYPELFTPNRVIFLDGVLQSTRYGNEAYHEALVQPAMFAHPNPKRVAIIGGGEGTTLREVLKHKSLEKVIMIEIDEVMVEFSRKHLPDWNDCSDILGSTDWCGDDPRADIRYEDGLAWFNNRFSENRINSEEYKEDTFDILIMDLLDPQDDIPFADVLYTNVPFLKSLYNSLSDDGIIVMQLGEAPYLDSPPENFTEHKKRGMLTQIMSNIGFQSIHIYEESHCGFYAPWTFLIGMKAEISRKGWYRSSANIDLDIHQKIIRTHSGKPNLKYFDGATMTSYQLPTKAFESSYCKAIPKPESCKSDKNEAEGTTSQAVRMKRKNIFDVYLDRHIYEKPIEEGGSINTLCDYFYYNESQLKYNPVIYFEEIKKQCTN